MRQFSREAGRTGLAQGKHRVNYGAAVRENMGRIERASADLATGIMTQGDYAALWRMQMETAMGASASGINALAEGMNTLVGLSDKHMGVMKLVAGSLQMTRAAIGIHRVYQTAIAAKAQREAAIAAGETTVAAAAQQWHRIAAAVGAAALVGTAFGGGWMVGHAIAGGTVDLSDAGSRRRATLMVRGAV